MKINEQLGDGVAERTGSPLSLDWLQLQVQFAGGSLLDQGLSNVTITFSAIEQQPTSDRVIPMIVDLATTDLESLWSQGLALDEVLSSKVGVWPEENHLGGLVSVVSAIRHADGSPILIQVNTIHNPSAPPQLRTTAQVAYCDARYPDQASGMTPLEPGVLQFRLGDTIQIPGYGSSSVPLYAGPDDETAEVIGAINLSLLDQGVPVALTSFPPDYLFLSPCEVLVGKNGKLQSIEITPGQNAAQAQERVSVQFGNGSTAYVLLSNYSTGV